MSEELDALTLVASRLDAAGIPDMVSGSTIWVASPEDLVLAELVWAKPSHSEVQLRDGLDLSRRVEARWCRALIEARPSARRTRRLLAEPGTGTRAHADRRAG